MRLEDGGSLEGDLLLAATGEPLPAARVDALIREILPGRNREEFDARHDTDFAYVVTMTDAILDLVRKKLVTPEEAYAKSPAKGEMRAALSKVGIVLA